MLKRYNSAIACLLLATLAAILPCLGFAQAPANTAEQERQALVRFYQKRFPGTGVADWSLGAEAVMASRGTQPIAIPFTADNATNSADILAIGRKQWERKFNDGKSFANCFPNGGKRVAATYPQYDPKSKRVVTAEMALNRCLQLHGEPEFNLAQPNAIGPLAAYFRSLADGQKLSIRVSGAAAAEKFLSGKALYQRRIGQQNFACASCHVRYAGEQYASTGLSPVIGQAVSWPRLEPGGNVRSLQTQFARCMKRSGAEPFELGSDEMNNLEYFHAFLSNGLAIRPLQVLPR